MFDQTPQQGTSAQPIPQEPQDMFANVEATQASPQISTPPPPPAPASGSTGSGAGKKIIIAVLILVLVAIVGVGAWYVYSTLQSSNEQDTSFIAEDEMPEELMNEIAEESINETPQEPINETPEELINETPQERTTGVDTDGDGLTDAQEAILKTDPNSLDSDLDGLFDGEEMNIYQTNPLNADTDGDGFEDGTEVANGYNPKGAGRLFEDGAQGMRTQTETRTTTNTNNESL